MNITSLTTYANDFYKNTAKPYAQNAIGTAQNAWKNRNETWNSVVSTLDVVRASIHANSHFNNGLKQIRAIEISGDQILGVGSKISAATCGYYSINAISSIFSNEVLLSLGTTLATGMAGVTAIALTQKQDEFTALAQLCGAGAVVSIGRRYLQAQ